MPHVIAASDFTALRQEHPNCILLDARLEEDYWQAHPEGALSNCVFEVAFYERLPTQAPDTRTPILVYGAGPDSHESRVAAEKLEQLGYTTVYDLRQGMAGLEALDVDLVRQSASAPTLSIPNDALPLNLDECRLNWVGRNLLNRHWGSVAITAGELRFERGQLVGGAFTLDLRRIECADLAGTDLHAGLIGHLQTADFFDVENHPAAHVEIRTAAPIEGARNGSPNLRLTADLTLRGQTHPITFDAVTGYTPDGKPAAQATLAFDRTLWGSIYGSGKFFHRLAGHLVNDLIEIQVKIVAG